VTSDDSTLDRYERYEELYAPAPNSAVRPNGAWKGNHKPKKAKEQILADLTDDLSDVELAFTTTYSPSRHEQGWLLSSLFGFYDEGLITDVLSAIKGGKEASVYLCRAHPATGAELLAAKVYRPRMFRNLRNDAMYRHGREILVGSGRLAGRDSGQIERAIRNKSAFGQQAAHTSWLLYEFTALERLYQAGGAVPRPIHTSENAILMSYHGDRIMAAPTLNSVELEAGEAVVLFREALRNVDLMLQHDLIHGDLSAYNMLYWEGGITIIDFPQVVNLHSNPRARFILERDIRRTCEYFAAQGVDCDPEAIANEMWHRYVAEIDPEDAAADQSRLDMELALCES